MFPLKSLVKLDRFPFFTLILILVNTGLYIYGLRIHDPFLFITYGIVPAMHSVPNDIIPLQDKIYPFVTYMFMHGTIFHILFNMLFLYVFGCNVEARLGMLRYLGAYLLFGVLAGVVQVLASPDLQVPIIGASGAVAGVMGMYIVLYPLAKIKTLIILIIFILIRNVPAMVYVVIWLAVQIVNGSVLNTEGIAWWAHIGGFASGVVVGILFRLSGIRDKKTKIKEEVS